MTDRQVNIPLLRKAVEWAEAEAAKPADECAWDQSWWMTPAVFRAEELGLEVGECGTAYCIAGWTCFASGEEFHPNGEWTTHLADGVRIDDRAADLLGLSDIDANSLFSAYNDIAAVRRIAEDIAGERL